jgi:hypothetical protein
VLGLALAFIAYTALGHPHGRHAGLPRPLASAPAVAPGTAAAAGRPVGSHMPAEATAGYGKAGYATTGQVTAGHATAGQATAGQSRAPSTYAAIPLVVLDNTGRPAVARNATERFEQAGWTVSGTGTFSGDILSTAAYYDPASDGAQAAAEALQAQFPAIQRVRPRFDGLPRGPVVVVLTYDYSQEQTTS